MSLYNHVANKDAVLDGVVEVVAGEILAAVDEIEPPSSPAEWKPAMRQRILAARDVLLRHRWAPAVFESRSNAPAAVLQHYDSLLKLMLESGFSMDLAHHALHALGSRMLGFTQELFVNGNEEVPPEVSALMLQQMAARYPHLGELMKAIHARHRIRAGQRVRRPVRVRVRARPDARRARAAAGSGVEPDLLTDLRRMP